jgi:hypothetical protein
MTQPTPPDGLGEAGTQLWEAVLGDVPEGHEFDALELAALHDAARLADRAAALDAVVDRDGEMSIGVGRQPLVHPASSSARMSYLRIYDRPGHTRSSSP